jgi:DNA polymerase-3 subunit delta'
LIVRFYQSSHISAARVALVLPADRMNVNAANALLKLLEEPPENAFFILVTEFPGMLPSTIRSRCILNTLSAPAHSVARQWIHQQTGDNKFGKLPEDFAGGPIDGLKDLESGLIKQQGKNLEHLIKMIAGQFDPVELAAQLAKQNMLPLLDWLHQLSSDLIKWQAAGQKPCWMGKLELQSDELSPIKLHELYDKIGRYRRMARDQLNAQLALEELLIFMQQAFIPVTLIGSTTA